MKRSSCEQAALWISRRIDGEFGDAGELAALNQHLAQCRNCRELDGLELSRAVRLSNALRISDLETAAMAQEVLARAEEPEVTAAAEVYRLPERTRRSWAAVGAVAAVFLGSVWVGWQFLPGFHSGSPPAELRYVWEETVESSRLLPGEDGAPVRRDVERQRRWVLPVRAPSDPAGDRPGGGVGVEKIDARNVELISWPYR